MKSVSPDDLLPHRVFFTDFDRVADAALWSTPSERAAIARRIEARLKLLILTKGHVVVAASQLLESPFAHDLLRRHPDLLSSGAIVSSLKLGPQSSMEFLLVKRDEAKADAKNPYHLSEAAELASLIDNVGTSVRWRLSDMSDWFRDRLAGELDDGRSLLRVALRREGILPPPDLATELRGCTGLSRGDVDRIARAAGIPRLRDVLRLYADFCYYLGGARGIRSEGVLPQENLFDFSLSELLGGDTRLTEHEVFFKLFIDAVKARTATVFPSDFLDAITIEDALQLRAVALSRTFIEKYNAIQVKTKEGLDVRDPERLVLLLEEIEQFERELARAYDEELDKELPTRLVESRQKAAGQVLQSVASILIPGYAPDSYRDVVVHGLRWAGREDAARAMEDKMARTMAACRTALESAGLVERQVLVDFVEAMCRAYQGKMLGSR